MNKPLKVMAVVCHSADAIDGGGSTLCLHVERGDAVTMVVCTRGVDTHDLERNDALWFVNDAPSDQAAPISRKESEVREGLGILGITDVRARKCIEVTNGRMGLHWCLPYAEAFQPMFPHTHSHLPANDHLLNLSSTPSREHYTDLRIGVGDLTYRGSQLLACISAARRAHPP